MAFGIFYDSPEGRAIAGGLTALMTGVTYATSAKWPKSMGPLKAMRTTKTTMLRVMRNHRRAAYGKKDGYEKLDILRFSGYSKLHYPRPCKQSAKSVG